MAVTVEPFVLLCAFRYALGRRTYIVAEITEVMRRHKDALVPLYGRKIVEEIEHAVEHDLAGDTQDVVRWVDLAAEFARAIGAAA